MTLVGKKNLYLILYCICRKTVPLQNQRLGEGENGQSGISQSDERNDGNANGADKRLAPETTAFAARGDKRERGTDNRFERVRI